MDRFASFAVITNTRFMNVKPICATLSLIAWAVAPALSETKFEGARATLEKWAETRQLFSREKADWGFDKEALEQQIALLEKEQQLLKEQIAKAEATATQADKERERLIEENEALSAASGTIRASLVVLEKRLLELSKTFPPPLMERIEPLFKRLPTNPALTKLSLAERMQNIIGIMSEVDKFNGMITVVSEVKRSPAGADVQVKTMYLGLGAGFFVDTAGRFAGLGTPTADGWQWRTRNDLADRIAKAIFIYENASAAAFVSLPVTITGQKLP